jgi:hypothetical protein
MKPFDRNSFKPINGEEVIKGSTPKYGVDIPLNLEPSNNWK